MSNQEQPPQRHVDADRDRHRRSSEIGGDLESRLDRIDARLDRLERSIGRLTGLLDQVPLAVGGLTDFVDSTIGDDGVAIDIRLRQLVRITDKLTGPEVLDGLEQLAERGAELQKLVALAEALPDGMAMAVDIFDDLVARSIEEGTDIVEVGRQLGLAATKFARFVKSPEFQAVLDSGVLDPRAVQIVGNVGDALAQAGDRNGDGEVGLFGLFKAMRDDDIRQAVGFAVAFARHFGARIDTKTPRRLPE